MLLTFRSLYDEQGSLTVIVFDVARFPDDTKWAYVADAVGRSGANPLRGLGRLLRSPFIDVSRLYHLPADETGVVATSLGARYSELAPDAALLHSGRPLCGELHSAAVIAHAERLQVTGVLVAEPYLHEFDFLRVLNR
ncbi:MAG: hypothetical protein JSW54_11180 [Fidelibacterota bacterium]|nr:MAG: hypothetical protein JSW54_11180 [Candidatus Neomarinimicrobiota bacterium]